MKGDQVDGRASAMSILRTILKRLDGERGLVTRSMDEQIRELSTRVEDANISRISGMTDNIQLFDGIPLPSVVEISESGTCNRKCAFCPRSAPGFPDVKQFIDARFGRSVAAYPFQAAAPSHRKMAVTQYLIWEAVQSAVARGIGRIPGRQPGVRIESEFRRRAAAGVLLRCLGGCGRGRRRRRGRWRLQLGGKRAAFGGAETGRNLAASVADVVAPPLCVLEAAPGTVVVLIVAASR